MMRLPPLEDSSVDGISPTQEDNSADGFTLTLEVSDRYQIRASIQDKCIQSVDGDAPTSDQFFAGPTGL